MDLSKITLKYGSNDGIDIGGVLGALPPETIQGNFETGTAYADFFTNTAMLFLVYRDESNPPQIIPPKNSSEVVRTEEGVRFMYEEKSYNMSTEFAKTGFGRSAWF